MKRESESKSDFMIFENLINKGTYYYLSFKRQLDATHGIHKMIRSLFKLL
jgi:hypothetical protein